MKKTLLIVFAIISLFLITGCGKKNNDIIVKANKVLICTKEETDEQGYKTKEEMKVVYSKKKVLTVIQDVTSETDPQVIDYAISAGKKVEDMFSDVEGIKISYSMLDTKTIKSSIEVDLEKVNIEKLKSKFKGILTEEELSMFTARDTTIDEFKKQELEGYKCK